MNAKPKLLDVVALTVDLPQENLWQGQVGTVVEPFDKGAAFEVEFSDSDGRTFRMLALRPEQILCLHFKPLKADSLRAAQTVSVVSEETPCYGQPRTCGRQIVVTAEKMKRMRAPLPAEPERMTELEAEANLRKRKRATKSMEATAYLLRSSANEKRLRAAVKNLEAGKSNARKH